MSESSIPAPMPHDAFFKAVFSRTEEAAAFFQAYLPGEIVRECDWSKLVLEPGSFVDKDMVSTHSDLLFSVPFQNLSTLVYLLFEHNSRGDRLSALWLLRYLVNKWVDWTEKHPGEPLPPIIPVVLHQDKRPWAGPVNFASLIAKVASGTTAEAIARYTPDFEFRVVDLAAMDLGSLMGTMLGRVALDLMGSIRQGDIEGFVERQELFFTRLNEARSDSDQIQLVIRYLLSGDMEITYERVRRLFEALPAPTNQTTMTIAEIIKAEGVRQGLEQGIEKGIEQGIEKGFEQGIEKGIKKGALVGRIQAYQDLFGGGITPEDVLLRLSLEELRELDAELKARR